MKVHARLIRVLLERLEAQPSAWGTIELPADAKYPVEVVDYHLVLCKQAGFIIYGGKPRDGCYQLTWEGHQHLTRLRVGASRVSSPARRPVSQPLPGDPGDVGRSDATDLGDDG